MADLSFNVIGNDRASSTFEKVAAQIDKMSAKIDKLSRQRADIKVTADTRQATASIKRMEDTAARIGVSSGGKFGDAFKARLTAAFKSLPDAKITADTSDADRAVIQIRGALESLSKKRIGIDIDEKEALAQLSALTAMLDGISKNDTRVSVRANTAAAKAELVKFGAELDKLAMKKVDVKVKADTSVASASLARLKTAATGAGGGMSGLIAAIVPLAAVAVPALAVTGAAAVAMGGAFAGAGVAVGAFALVAAPAFKKVEEASKAQKKMNDAVSKYGPKSKQAAQATKEYQSAMAGLTPAQRSLASAVTNAKNVFSAWQKSMEPTVIPILTSAMGLLKPALSGLTNVLQGAKAGFLGFLQPISTLIKSQWFQTFTITLGNLARQALPIFGQALANGVQGLGNLITAFRPITNIVLNGLQSMMSKFAQWSSSLQSNQGFQNFINYVKENAPKVMALFGSIVGAIGKIVAAVAPIGAVVMPVLTFLFNTIRNIPTPVLTGLAIAIGVVTAALWAMSLTPIVAVILAIIAAIIAVFAVIQHWGAIWNWLKGIILAVVGWMVSFLQGAWNVIKAGFTIAWNAIKLVFSTVWNAIKTVAVTVWNAIAGFFTRVWNGFKAQWVALWNGIKSLFSSIWNGIKSVATTVWNAISGFFSRAFAAYKAAFTLIWNTIKSVFSSVWNWIKSIAMSVWNGISSFFSRAFQAYKTAFTIIWNTIKSVFSTVWNWIKNTAVSVWNSISSFFSRAFNGFKNVFHSVWNGIKDFFGGIWRGMVDTAKKLWDGLKKIVATPINFVINTILNDGLFKAWNWIAGKLGMDSLKISRLAPVKFAEGGILPGYAPGRDTVPAMLSPGEAILTPGAARALGHANINALNAAHRPGGAAQSAMGHYSFGSSFVNVVKDIAGFGGDALKVVGIGTKAAGDLFSDPVGFSTKMLNAVVKPLLGSIGAGDFGKILGGLPKKIIGGMLDKVKGWFAGGDISGIVATGAGQLAMAKVIGQVGKRMGFDHLGIVIALMTALQESGLRNLNYGDRDSLGLFQQRPSMGWGSPAQILNPAYAASKFFQGLRGVNYHAMPPTVAAQSVQRSAFPGAYAKWQGTAESLARAGGFDRGGEASGIGFMPKWTRKPERVLSPQQTADFGRLVDALTSGSLNGMGVHNTFHMNNAGQSPEEVASELMRRQLLAMR